MIREAGREVARPVFFAVLIIIIVYLPILTLEGVEGKMFRPMALTVVFALVGSLILALTLMPVLASLLFQGDRRQEHEPRLDALAEGSLSALAAPDGGPAGSSRRHRRRRVRGVARPRAVHGHRVHSEARRRRHRDPGVATAERVADRVGQEHDADRDGR